MCVVQLKAFGLKKRINIGHDIGVVFNNEYLIHGVDLEDSDYLKDGDGLKDGAI